MDEDLNQVPANQSDDDQIDLEEVGGNNLPPAQDPASPQSIAPQIQDEEAEKRLTAEKGAGADPDSAAEEILGTDNQTAKEQLPENELDKQD